MHADRTYKIGDGVYVEADGFLADDEHRERFGIVTDVFYGPVSGVPIYVVGDTGYTASELRPAALGSLIRAALESHDARVAS